MPYVFVMLRLGLCCIFSGEPIKFRRMTAASLARNDRRQSLHNISDILIENAASLEKALLFCAASGIGAFRLNSQIWPLKTHPQHGYELCELPDRENIMARFKNCGEFARQNNLRTTLHPDQFVLLSSADAAVTEHSVNELRYQAEIADLVGADVINIHAGGTYGNKASALKRVATHLAYLPEEVRSRLTLENDDRSYSPADLLELCARTGTPLVYDVHHHRCRPDGLTVEAATSAASATWNREPLMHISSPRDGWNGSDPRRHHDYIDIRDFPDHWKQLDITVEVEAKELAVLKLKKDLRLK